MSPKLSSLSQAVALTILGASITSVSAQEQKLERVEITGSSIKRVESETALPVTVITRAQIEKTGANNVEDLLRRVASNSAMVSDSTQGAGYGTSNANLRGLGPNSTLILLNGRRLANHPFGSVGGTVAVDLNSIPFAAIERIEVLRDGASAIYGTDAVGGVINFITRRDYQNFEITLKGGDTAKNIGGSERGITVSAGMGDLTRDGYNVLFTANGQTNTRLRAIDQGYYNRAVTEIPGASPPTSGRAFPGRLVDFGITPGAYANAGSLYSPCDPAFTVARVGANKTPNGSDAKFCRFIYNATLDNLPDQDKRDFFARGMFALNADTTLYAEASYAENHGIGRIAPVPIDSTAGHVDPATGKYPSFSLPTSSKYYPAALLASLGYTNAQIYPASGFTEISMRAVPVGNRINDNTNSQSRIVTGVKGTWDAWDYDLGLNLSEGKGDLKYYGYINEPKFIAALKTGKINPFGPQDAEGLALLQSTLMEGSMRASTSKTTELDFRASRELGAMAGGNMAIAVGASFRREAASDHPTNDDYRKGLHIGGEGSVPDTEASRTVSAVFSELSLPFAKGWEGSLAVRADRYSDFGSSVNPRAALRYQPSKQLMLRTAIGTGFRAPSLWDVYAPTSFTNTANSAVDPDCPPGKASDPRCETQFNVQNVSSKNLKPETSRQFTMGVVWEPIKNVSANIDYYYIQKNDQIGQVTGDSIMGDPKLYQAYKSRIVRGADGFISYISQPVENLGGLKTSGIDFDLRTNWSLADMGKLQVALAGSYVLSYKQQPGKGMDYIDYAGTGGDGGGVAPVPRWQHTLGFDWSQGPLSVTLENNYVRGWTEAATLVENNVGVATDYHVKNSSRWNLSSSYKFNHNLSIRLGVKNLTDKAPPFTAVSSYGSHAGGYASSFVDPRGRYFFGSMTVTFK